MKPAVFRHRNLLQLSYESPHHIRASAVYPLRSPNGSRIIVYGHEEGLRVIWYGGRPYKSTTTTADASKVNGSGRDEPMVIDLSDDDDQPETSAVEKVEFDDEENEIDTTQPYRHILRYIDIPFGTSATHLAVPHISASREESSSGSYAPILSTHIVVATACADRSIRLVTLPLTPPSPSSHDPSSWNLHITQIPAEHHHRDFITGISMTDFAEGPDDGMGGEKTKSRSRSRSGAGMVSKSLAGVEWSLLIASTSCTGSGLLLVHKIPFTENNTVDPNPESLVPIQRHLLRSPLSACRLSFNPSSHPAERASNLLVILPDSGCVKVFQTVSSSTHARGRRGSGATVDSNTSSAGSTRKSSTIQGRLLITLYPNFNPPREGEPFGSRKRPLDAAWVLGGRAILVLFEDGDWGVWDLEAAGPTSPGQTQNLVKGQAGVSGIQGGSFTKFTIRGTLTPFTSAMSKSKTGNRDASNVGSLAPATPHARKSRSDQLFEGRGQMIVADTPSRGGLCVVEAPSSTLSPSLKVADESILFTYGDFCFCLPSLLTYWRTEASGRGTFGVSGSAKPIALPSIRLGGMPLKAAYQFPSGNPVESALDSVSSTPDTVAVTEQTLILLLAPLSESSVPKAEHKQPLAGSSYGRDADGDALLLERGELGIDGLDNMLNDMTNGNSRALGKSVGFNIDEDMDVDMHGSVATPTPKVTGRQAVSRSNPRATLRPGQAKVKLFS